MPAIIIHGTKSSPHMHWFQWLKKELEKLGVKAEVPKFPTPEGESLDAWLGVLDKYEVGSDTVLVGHSIGPALILQKLQRMDSQVKGIVLVSGFLGKIGMPEYDELNKTFFENLDLDKAKANAGKIQVFYGTNDPYVPLSVLEQVATSLGVEPIVIENGGHLNAEVGYTKFPEVLEAARILVQA